MKTKNKGSAAFIIIIPILIVLLAFLYDNILMITNNKAYKEITNSIVKEAVSNNYTDMEGFIKQEYNDKKLETDQLRVTYDNGVLTVYNVHTYPAFFGIVFGVKTYRAEVNVEAYLNENNEVQIKEVNGD